LLRKMPQMRRMPNVISFEAVISACEKGTQWEVALSLLREIRS
jgi:pentatricopeptide repeat domain-containing protein 1